MPDSYQPQPEQVTDVAVEELIATAKLIAEDLESTSAGGYLIGAATRAHVPKSDWAAPRLQGKINAGAQFAQIQICFDMNVMRKFVAHLVSLKLLQRCSVIADVAVLPSAEYARWLRDNLSHVLIPNRVIRRLERAEDPEQEGITICAELLREIAAIPGVSGANLISMGSPEMTIQVIQESGLQGE